MGQCGSPSFWAEGVRRADELYLEWIRATWERPSSTADPGRGPSDALARDSDATPQFDCVITPGEAHGWVQPTDGSQRESEFGNSPLFDAECKKKASDPAAAGARAKAIV